MSTRRIINLGLIALIGLLALGAVGALIYTKNMIKFTSQHETIVIGQETFLPGEQAALRLVVRNSVNAAPLPEAEITVLLTPQEGGKAVELYRGRTDAAGTADLTFTVPQDAARSQTLRIETSSSLGSDYLERPVTVERTVRLLLTTDKPVYQPGQTIHLRALALDDFSRQAAAGQALEFTVADGKGNKVFRQVHTTSEFGVASADFQLASEVNLGNYKISATLGGVTSEKTVEVKRYQLPKFAITLQPERTFYLPGQHVSVALLAAYFYGKPVSHGQVSITGYTYDVARQDVFTQEGQTDESGNYEFEFDMPDFLAGSELENGLGSFYLEASVVDQAAHEETSNLSLPVAQQPLIIEAMPESGVLRSGLENILYVLVSMPDGSPVDASIAVWGQDVPAVKAQTGSGGLAEVHITPTENTVDLVITAKTAAGDSAEVNITPGIDPATQTVLLRPDKPVYQVGEPMKLAIFSTGKSLTAYLDIVKGRQTLSTRAVDLKEGRADVVVDLTPDLAGTLELHAYTILPDGNYVRDTRLVVVNAADELAVSLQPDCSTEQREDGQCVYRPGDPIGLDVQVQDIQGAGMHAALGLAIVDESVFAVASQDPGFERLYFLLEQGLLEPKYDIHGYSVPELVYGDLPQEAAQEQAVRGAAFASLASVIAPEGIFGMYVNSHAELLNRIRTQEKKQTEMLGAVYGYSSGWVALAAVLVSSFALAARKRFWVGVGMTFLSWIALGGCFWGLSVLLYTLNSRDTEVFLLLIIGGIGLALFSGVILLLVRAIQQKDLLLGWSLGLLGLFTLLFIAFLFTLSDLSDYIPVIVAFIALLIMISVYMGMIFAAGVFKPIRSVPLVTLLLVSSLLLANCAGAQQMVGALQPGTIKEEAAVEGKTEADAALAKPEAPRLRQYFPETLLWLPEAVTDAQGKLHLDFAAADSITTWRMTALASTTDGKLGSTTAPLRVFQDFFIDLDLPQALTVGDELSVPVGVFNYLSVEQKVRLEVQPAAWFELLDEPVKEITIAANEITVVYFRLRALQFGLLPFQVTAYGTQMSDAMLKNVQVYPDGRQNTFSQSDYLSPEKAATMPVTFPGGTITGTQSLLVKIYPGVLSQVVEGLEAMLRMPYGCFEQTSSTTYPNVLVLDYLKTTGQVSPEVQFTAEGYINQGYQRLVTFEVGSSGGFSLFGNEPADRMLTAYGLQEFADMSRVFPVDPALIERAAKWLFEQQSPDGSWENDRGLVHESSWSGLQDDRLPVTAYIAWSLVSAGYAQNPGTQKALEYIETNQEAANQPYVLALVANALVEASRAAGGSGSTAVLSPSAEAALANLAETAKREQDKVYWTSGVQTYMGGSGQAADSETTAMAALAFMRSGRYSDLATAALNYLVGEKDDFGTWHSTLATVMTLKALLESTRGGSELADAEVSILLNGQLAGQVQVTAENFDVVQLISLNDYPLEQENTIELRMQGQGNLMYQVTGSYYLPWGQVVQGDEPFVPEAADLRVQYDRSELAVGETVRVDVRFAPNEPGVTIASAMVEVGLPPGFNVVTEDLDALITASLAQPADSPLPTIERYELAGRKLLVYVSNVSSEYPLTFSFRERARFPLHAQTFFSSGYDYYNPQLIAEEAPVVLTVK